MPFSDSKTFADEDKLSSATWLHIVCANVFTAQSRYIRLKIGKEYLHQW